MTSALRLSPPDLFQDSLTVWAVTVAAGIIVDFHVPAVAALT